MIFGRTYWKAMSAWVDVQINDEPQNIVIVTPNGNWKTTLEVEDTVEIIFQKITKKDYPGNEPFVLKNASQFITKFIIDD